jgi:hypothetical protein
VKITFFLKVLLKGTVNFENEYTPQLASKMRQSIDKLEMLIYGKILQH